MNQPAPRIVNPLDWLIHPGAIAVPLAAGGVIVTPDVAKQVQQGVLGDPFAGITKTFNDNAPAYAVGLFGIILIVAGVYSLAK